MAFLLSLTTMIYGMNVARSIIQEKTSRIFEVMLATVKPTDMLAGKLIGVGAVGLTQIAIWLVAGVGDCGLALCRGHADGPVRHALFLVRGRAVSGLLPAWLLALQLALCRPGRHLRNRAGTADVHAAGRRAHLAQLRADRAHHQRLEFVWSVAASLFPPTAPIVMFLRMASEIPPAWQFGVSIGLMVLSIWAHAVVLVAALSRGHPDVRQARHAAGAAALAALLLSEVAGSAF